jgi:hypothetical protein
VPIAWARGTRAGFEDDVSLDYALLGHLSQDVLSQQRNSQRNACDGVDAKPILILLFQFFWEARENLAPYSQPAQVGAALVLIAALCIVAYGILGY